MLRGGGALLTAWYRTITYRVENRRRYALAWLFYLLFLSTGDDTRCTTLTSQLRYHFSTHYGPLAVILPRSISPVCFCAIGEPAGRLMKFAMLSRRYFRDHLMLHYFASSPLSAFQQLLSHFSAELPPLHASYRASFPESATSSTRIPFTTPRGTVIRMTMR